MRIVKRNIVAAVLPFGLENRPEKAVFRFGENGEFVFQEAGETGAGGFQDVEIFNSRTYFPARSSGAELRRAALAAGLQKGGVVTRNLLPRNIFDIDSNL